MLLTLRESPPARPKTATLEEYGLSGIVGQLSSNDAQRSCFEQGSVGARRETKERRCRHIPGGGDGGGGFGGGGGAGADYYSLHWGLLRVLSTRTWA